MYGQFMGILVYIHYIDEKGGDYRRDLYTIVRSA